MNCSECTDCLPACVRAIRAPWDGLAVANVLATALASANFSSIRSNATALCSPRLGRVGYEAQLIFSPPAFTKVTARQAEDAEIAERRTKIGCNVTLPPCSSCLLGRSRPAKAGPSWLNLIAFIDQSQKNQ